MLAILRTKFVSSRGPKLCPHTSQWHHPPFSKIPTQANPQANGASPLLLKSNILSSPPLSVIIINIILLVQKVAMRHSFDCFIATFNYSRGATDGTAFVPQLLTMVKRNKISRPNLLYPSYCESLLAKTSNLLPLMRAFFARPFTLSLSLFLIQPKVNGCSERKFLSLALIHSTLQINK